MYAGKKKNSSPVLHCYGQGLKKRLLERRLQLIGQRCLLDERRLLLLELRQRWLKWRRGPGKLHTGDTQCSGFRTFTAFFTTTFFSNSRGSNFTAFNCHKGFP
ncbi:hypothetical protein LguiA_006428 [Lonicera macranthoides]